MTSDTHPPRDRDRAYVTGSGPRTATACAGCGHPIVSTRDGQWLHQPGRCGCHDSILHRVCHDCIARPA